MAVTSARKLPRADRREQLLETAHVIAREEGTDALTLGHLALRAGVSKPIAYEHFQTRSRLMIALYKRINDRQTAILAAALADTPQRLDAVAQVMGEAYMSCYTAVGPEWHAIGAALRGDAEMEAYQQDVIDGHIDFYAKALGPLCTLAEPELRRRCVGIVGAADAISRDMVRGRISKDAAAADLTSLIVEWLS